MGQLRQWDLDYGILLPLNHSLKCVKGKKTHIYTFYNRRGKEIASFEGKAPLSITTRHAVGKEIMQILTLAVEDGSLDNNKKKNMFKNILNQLAEYVDNYELTQQLIDRAEQQELERKESEDVAKALNFFNGLDEPIVWLGSQIDWLTAGERGNILKAFFTFCSQIILRHPISLIGLGEGSSGKDHIRSIARGLCPEEFFLDEKKPTLASMFRRSLENPHYYDGKIVCYGDLGGDNDQDEVHETKDILKEMQTDGYVNRPINMGNDGEYEVVDLELYGYPALNYTTVPNYTADSQELSRSLVITPKTNNRKEFYSMMHTLEFVGSPLQIRQSEIEKNLFEKIPLIVKGLRSLFEDIKIINPYTRNVEKFLGETEYFKRDFKKFNHILKVISAFNYFNKTVHEINGVKIIFVDKYDLSLFFTLFSDQKRSISTNLSPVASRILNDFASNFDEMYYEVLSDHPDEEGLSVNEYYERGNVSDVSKRSVQRYFKELNEQGYLKIIGSVGKSNLYALSESTVCVGEIDLQLFKETARMICDAYGNKICEVLKQDLTPVDASVFNQHEFVDAPPWRGG